MTVNAVRAATGTSTATLDGRYQLLRRLHASHNGMLHLAVETRLQRHVAIKMMERDAEEAGRFNEVVQFLSRIDHPNCIAVLDTGSLPEGFDYAVMPYVEGERLRDVLAAGPLTPIRAATIGAALLRGLSHVHRTGAIHRDLKPECLILPKGEDSGLRIVGFWSASVPSARNSGAGISLGDLDVGTPEYTSPEQAMGLPVDGRSDVYAAGVILFEMLHGRAVFVSDDPFAVLQMHIQGALPRLREDIPAEIAALVTSMLSKDPISRPPASEAAAQLEAFVLAMGGSIGGRRMTPPRLTAVVTEGVSSTNATVPEDLGVVTTVDVQPRSRAGWFVAAALAVVGVGATWWLTRPDTAPTAEMLVAAASVVPSPAPAPPDTAAQPLSKTLQALAEINERRPEHAKEYAERHVLVAELTEAGHREKIDGRVQLELDLLQAAQSATPCTTFSASLEQISRANDPFFAQALERATVPSDAPGAGVAPDGACTGLEARLEDVRRPAAPPVVAPQAAVEPASAAASAPASAHEPRRRKSKGGSQPASAKPSNPVVAKNPDTKPMPRVDEGPRVIRIDDDIKRQ